MMRIISDDCINCGVCETECPANAVHPEGAGIMPVFINNIYYNETITASVHYYINPFECTNCAGVYDKPRCNDVCPVSCCLYENLDYAGETSNINPALVSLNKISLN